MQSLTTRSGRSISRQQDIHSTGPVRSDRSMNRVSPLQGSPGSSAGMTRTGRIQKTPRKKKQRGEKVKAPKIAAPLSELTAGWEKIPIRDMEEWVNRPIEVRKAEVAKRNGYITRPMNSFMLYRSAYAERTKQWCHKNNHQVVSSVSGASWPMEPEEIRDRYHEYARIERINHQNAHPDYKFSPSKVSAAAARKRDALKEESEEELSDLEDMDFGGPVRRVKRRPRAPFEMGPSHTSICPSTLSEGVHDPSVGDNSNSPNKSSYQHWYPGKPLPAAMNSHELNGQYYQTTVRPNTSQSGVEDVSIHRTAIPGLQHGQDTNTPGFPTNYGGIYYGQPLGSSEDHKIDPNLLAFDHHAIVGNEQQRFNDSAYSSSNLLPSHSTFEYQNGQPAFSYPASMSQFDHNQQQQQQQQQEDFASHHFDEAVSSADQQNITSEDHMNITMTMGGGDHWGDTTHNPDSFEGNGEFEKWM
jgi:HMG (high mobility group) box